MYDDYFDALENALGEEEYSEVNTDVLKVLCKRGKRYALYNEYAYRFITEKALGSEFLVYILGDLMSKNDDDVAKSILTDIERYMQES